MLDYGVAPGREKHPHRAVGSYGRHHSFAPGRGLDSPADGAGHGIAGMRERAAMLGGTLDAGPLPEGGFRVRARLPLGASR